MMWMRCYAAMLEVITMTCWWWRNIGRSVYTLSRWPGLRTLLSLLAIQRAQDRRRGFPIRWQIERYIFWWSSPIKNIFKKQKKFTKNSHFSLFIIKFFDLWWGIALQTKGANTAITCSSNKKYLFRATKREYFTNKEVPLQTYQSHCWQGIGCSWSLWWLLFKSGWLEQQKYPHTLFLGQIWPTFSNWEWPGVRYCSSRIG